MLILGSPFNFAPGTMQAAIDRLGLTSGLKLCLDASDINSYSGSGQSWLDTSGNGYDFLRGSTSASQATDPTFNGVAGAQSSSEYWAFDGGDYFTYDTTNETWMQNIHKDSALFTLAGYSYMAAVSTALAGTDDLTAGIACWQLVISSGQKLLFRPFQNGGSAAASIASTANIPLSQWVFWALSVNEAAGTGTIQLNGTQESPSTTYASPGTTNSGAAMKLAALGTGSSPAASGSRFASFMAWEGAALSAAQLSSLYEVTKGKFGL